MKTTAKRGAPKKSFEDCQRSTQYAKASQIADNESLGAISKAATIKAHREGLTDTSYVYRKLEGDAESVAADLRKAEKAAKKPCNYNMSGTDESENEFKTKLIFNIRKHTFPKVQILSKNPFITNNSTFLGPFLSEVECESRYGFFRVTCFLKIRVG